MSHADAPTDHFEVQRFNHLTGKVNYLHWAQLEFHFCTVLILRRHDGSFHQLRHFHWNVHWNSDFSIAAHTGGMVQVILASTGVSNTVTLGHFIDGAVTGGPFAGIITQPVVMTCNDVAKHEADHPNVKEHHQWL